MKEFVKAKPFNGEHRLLQCINNSAGGVENSAQENESEDRNAAIAPERWQVEDCSPPQCAVEGDVEPAGSVNPTNPHKSGEEGSTPDEGEKDDRLTLAQEEDGEGGVGAGDQNGDIGVVDPAPKRPVPGLPLHPVVEGATGEQSDRSERKNAQSDPSAELVSDRNHHNSRYQGDRGHDEVDQPAQLRLGLLLLGLGLDRVLGFHALKGRGI